MAFKDVLVALTTYPQPTPVPAVESTIALAAALGARVSAIGCGISDDLPGGLVGDLVFDMPQIMAAERARCAANAAQLLATFQHAAEARGVFLERISEQALAARIPELMVGYARLYDLTMVPVPVGDHVDQWYAESIIFGSGRPTLVVPHHRGPGPAADSIVVGWDFSRSASRAVADALPILESAKRVTIVTVINEKAMDGGQSGAELARHLARHGIDVTLDVVDAAGRGIGEVLRACVAAHAADVLVMGAYGHSRIREFVLGGATRSMLANPPVPVLFSH